MSVWFEDDGLNESQPAGSIPDFEPDLLTVEDIGADADVDAGPDRVTCADEVL